MIQPIQQRAQRAQTSEPISCVFPQKKWSAIRARARARVNAPEHCIQAPFSARGILVGALTKLRSPSFERRPCRGSNGAILSHWISVSSCRRTARVDQNSICGASAGHALRQAQGERKEGGNANPNRDTPLDHGPCAHVAVVKTCGA